MAYQLGRRRQGNWSRFEVDTAKNLNARKESNIFYPLFAGYVVISLVSIGLTIIQHRGGLSRNSAIGIRTKPTLISDEAWTAAQRSLSPYPIALALIAGSHALALVSGRAALANALGTWNVILVCGVLLIALAVITVHNRPSRHSKPLTTAWPSRMRLRFRKAQPSFLSIFNEVVSYPSDS